MQESSDSCDSETTVTSHPSQDVATPLALDHPAFEPFNTTEKDEVLPAGPVEADGRQGSSEEHYHDQNSKEVPQYVVHHLPLSKEKEPHQNESHDEEAAPSEDRNLSAAEQELQCEVGHISNMPDRIKDPEPTQEQSGSTINIESPTKEAEVESWTREEDMFSNQSDSVYDRVSSSPVLGALKRAQQNYLSRGGQRLESKSNSPNPVPARGQGQGRGVPLQRSSSLPSSVLSPSKVVSSVSIQFGKGQASCTPPRYSFRFTQEDGVEREIEQEEKEGQTKLSTLVLKPASSSCSNKKTNYTSEAPIPPKPIPRYLTKSSCSLQSSSPLPDLSPGGSASSWGTRSVPDLSTAQRQHRKLEENTETNPNYPGWIPGQMTSPYFNCNHNTSAQYLNPSPSPSPYPVMLNPPLQYPSPLQPYASLPNLCQYNMLDSPSLTSPPQHVTPSVHQCNSSLLNLHQPPSFSTPHHSSLGNLHFGPALHSPGYNHLNSNQPSQHSTPHLGYHGYNTFPQSLPQCAPLAPEHSQGPAPHPPGFLPGLSSSFSSFTSFHSAHTPPAMSSTEMQLRKVLHDIKGAVQSLGQVSAFRCLLRLLIHFPLHFCSITFVTFLKKKNRYDVMTQKYLNSLFGILFIGY